MERDGQETDFAAGLQSVIILLVHNAPEEAETVLRVVAQTAAVAALPRQSIPLDRQCAVFRRDNFSCRYCGRRTIFLPVLRFLARQYPEILPYHPNWKMTACHIAFWREVASCDHLIPVARGGNASLSNLITACYMCNSIKQNWLVEELRWAQYPISPSDWDGLSSHYAARLAKDPKGQSACDRTWLHAMQTEPTER